MKQTHCDHCGDPLPRYQRKYCNKAECKRYGDLMTKKKVRDQVRQLGLTRRKPKGAIVGHPGRRCQYPPNATKKCGRSLANTNNYFFCKEHASKVHAWEGIETCGN